MAENEYGKTTTTFDTVAGGTYGLAVKSVSDNNYGLGATRLETAVKIVLPAALSGIAAAFIVGISRAIGETMIVLMASGNASILSWRFFDSARTLTATIAAELAETVVGGTHYRVLFLIGAMIVLIRMLAAKPVRGLSSTINTLAEGNTAITVPMKAGP